MRIRTQNYQRKISLDSFEEVKQFVDLTNMAGIYTRNKRYFPIPTWMLPSLPKDQIIYRRVHYPEHA